MLIAALYASNTGIQAATSSLDVTSNNVANSNTTGFKSALMSFQDLPYTGPIATPPGPIGTQLGSGTAVGSVASNFTQGPLNRTAEQFDLAISGQGFFQVDLGNGTVAYTRAGNFNLDDNQQLVTSDGFKIVPPITIPSGTSAVSVGTDGTVSATTPNGVQTVGQITLTQFQNPGGLLRIGNTLFAATEAAGAATTGTAGTNGLGIIQQGFLEGSNVDLTSQLINLLIAQQTVAFNSQAVVTVNAMLAATIDLIQ